MRHRIRCGKVRRGHLRYFFTYTRTHKPLHKGESPGFLQFIGRDVRHVTFLAPGLQDHFQNADFKNEEKVRGLTRRGEAIGKGERGVYLRYRRSSAQN